MNHELRSERKLLILLAAVQFTHVLDFVIMMPLGPQFIRVFSISPREFGLLVSSYQFSASIFGLLGALFLDRYARKPALLVLYFGFIVGTFICAIAPTYGVLMAARILAGAFGGVLGALVFSIIGDRIPESRRGAATGTVMSAFSVASVVGVPIGLFLANALEWHAPFFFISLIALLVLYAGFKWLPKMSENIKPSPAKFKFATQFKEIGKVLSYRNHWRAFGLTMTLMFGGFSLIPFISPFMVFNVGVEESELPYIYLCGGLFTFFTSRYFGVLSDRFGKRKVFITIAALSIFPILMLTHLPRLPLGWALAATTFFMILFSGRFVPAMSMITSSVDNRHRASFMSMNSSMQQMAAALASFMAGLIVERASSGMLINYDVVGWIATAFTLWAILLAAKLKYGERVSKLPNPPVHESSV